jgi:outer membrane autotransporter protein
MPPTPTSAPFKSESYGIRAASGSNVTIGDNLNILTTGIASYGVYAIEDSLLVIGDNATIATIGGDSYCGPCGQLYGWASPAVQVGSKNADISKIIIGNNANISTQGAIAPAIDLYGVNSVMYIGDNATITANGDRNTNAINLYNGGNLTIGNNAVITTTGDMVYYDDTGSNYNGQPHAITGAGSAVFTLGDNAVISTYGLYASAVQFNDALVVIGDNARITTYGEGRYTGQNSLNEGGFGIKIRNGYAALGPDMIIVGNNAIITTYGNQSVGVQVREKSTGIFGDNLTIITHGNNANALETYDRSNITVGDNAVITTKGDASHAVHTLAYNSQSASYAGDVTTIIGKNSAIFTAGSGSHAVFVEGTSNSNSTVILNANTNISAKDANSYAIYSKNPNGRVLTNGFSTMNILGNIMAENGGVIDLRLGSGSYFEGDSMLDPNTASAVSLAFDGSNSLWKLKSGSSLTNLSLTNRAKIDLTQGSSYNTLSIDNLAGEGVFYQRLDLSGTGDLIVINNSSSGNHKLEFDDSAFGGYNSTGTEGFLVVEQNQRGGAYNAVFTGEVYIGAYTYKITNINNTMLLATNAYNGGNGGPVINPVALSSISFANINYISNYANTQTLLQRIGELDTNRDTLDDTWIRTYAGELDSFDKKFDIDDANYYGLQAGFDRIYDIGGGKVFAGLTLGLSKTDINYKLGDGEVSSYDIGLYASYKKENNFYIDALLKYTRNKNGFDITTSNGVEITTDANANAYSLSIEGGKRFSIANGFYIEPQAELTLSRQSSGISAASSGLKTSFDDYNSILGRVGTIIGYNLKDKTNIYYKIGYIKELDGRISYNFNNGNKQTYELNGDVFDNAVGITSNIDDSHHIYFEGTYQIGDSFNNRKANLGYKYSF